jgi:hypothetical protein
MQSQKQVAGEFKSWLYAGHFKFLTTTANINICGTVKGL